MRRLPLALFAALTFAVSLIACNDAPRASTAESRTDTTAADATTNYTASALPRAKNGDTVWVIINHVKADKRQQFEQFVHQVFWDSASKLSAADQQVFRQTRVLHPTVPEKDGTYSYIFLMDPYIPGGNYNISALLNKMYGEPKASQYNKMLDETTTKSQTQYLEVQSLH
jgi:hypothetical protein